MVYELNDNLQPLRRHCLADREEIRKAMEAVARQGKAKGAF
jgi:hypothetical protein